MPGHTTPTGASTTAPSTATLATAPTSATLEPPPRPASGGLGRFDAACEALLIELLAIIEPYVAGRDVDDLMSGNLDGDGMAAATAGTQARLEVECPAIDNQTAFEEMIAIAGRAAPGAVWYLEAINRAAATQPG